MSENSLRWNYIIFETTLAWIVKPITNVTTIIDWCLLELQLSQPKLWQKKLFRNFLFFANGKIILFCMWKVS